MVVLVGVSCAAGAVHWVRQRAVERSAALAAATAGLELQLVPGTTDTLSVSDEAMRTLGVSTAPAEPAPPPEPLRLSGSLLLDSNKLAHVHTRFPGEVVKIGTVIDAVSGQQRQLRANDKVAAGQLLAVVWSKEVGEKKSDLVDALSKYWIDQANLNRLKRLEKGVVPERTILEAERAFESDEIAVDRVERTLRSWRLTSEEIEAVKDEARRIHGQSDTPAARQVDRTWAEVEVRAPFDGVVLEKNVVIGDIVDTSLDIFKIADLTKLAVLANVYEEDIPALEALAPSSRRWQISLKSDPTSHPIEGAFDFIGRVIDPNQHTGAVMGWVENADGKLRVGQFITAAIPLPPPKDQVAVPSDAVIDKGQFSMILVADSADPRRVTSRMVKVAGRSHQRVFIDNSLDSSDEAQGARPLHVGELVVTRGNVELAAILEELRGETAASRQLTRAP
jgi:cobalt-zinc-cadmium efflux system membrane fusion protein